MKSKIALILGVVLFIALIIWLPNAAFAIAFLALFTGASILVWALIKRKPKKTGATILAIGTITLIISAIVAGTNAPPTENKEAAQETEQPLKKDRGESPNKSSQQQTEAPRKQTEAKTNDVDPTNETLFEAYAKNLTGGPFIKTVKLKDEKATIKYVKSYKEYKKLKPNSSLKESDYQDYFSTVDKIDKILVGESVRLLRQFPALKQVSIQLPFNGKTYSIKVERKQVNDYLGFKVEELRVDDGSWNNKFINPIVYQEEEREKFIDRFGNVK